LLESGDEGVLGEVLGQAEVAGHPGEGADEPGRLLTPYPDEDLLRGLGAPGLAHTRRLGPAPDTDRVRRPRAPRPARRCVASRSHPPSPASAAGAGRPSSGPTPRALWQVSAALRLALGAALLLGVDFHDRPAADDLLGLGVRPVGDRHAA